MSRPEEKIERPIRVGIYETVPEVESAVTELRAAGFTEGEITVFCPDKEDQHIQQYEPPGETGPPLEHIAAGSAMGGTIGGLTIAATIATAGGIPVVVAGGMAALLAGGVVGGLAGAMANRGLEKESADFFDQAVAENRFLVAVEPEETSPQRLELASHTLEESGALPIPLREG